MSQYKFHWGALVAVSAVALLAACAQTPPPATASNPSLVASNPPPVPPGPKAVWHSVAFATNSYTVDANGRKVVNDVATFMQGNPASVATIIGRTETTMKLRMFAVLGFTLIAVSACVLEPYGGGGSGGYYGNQRSQYQGGGSYGYVQPQYRDNGYNQHDYGHPVWGG